MIDHIERALVRGKSRHTVSEVLDWIFRREAFLAIGDTMSGSWRFRDNLCEIVHVGGKWNDDDATWLLDRMWSSMELHGVTRMRYEGREGWSRFLRMKGIQL